MPKLDQMVSDGTGAETPGPHSESKFKGPVLTHPLSQLPERSLIWVNAVDSMTFILRMA